jgi:hypothetical protein
MRGVNACKNCEIHHLLTQIVPTQTLRFAYRQ